ncbi:MAG: DUF421 domain-containing protein [Peptococcaceae bacterium]|nr:DUF421 domain-containing protein [Peptococcaceae bacterium]
MLNMTFRVILVYIVLLLAMRMMGKREIGELSNTDFVVAIVVAELATLPITNMQLDLLHSLLPIVIITFLQLAVSFLCLKNNQFRHFVYSTPNVLIAKGKMQMGEMRKARYNIDDLLSQLRQNGVFDIAEVDYAILETSGELTVSLKQQYRPVTLKDLKIKPEQEVRSMPITLIDDGELNAAGMGEAGIDRKWLQDYLQKNNIGDIREVFFASMRTDGSLYLMTREEALKSNNQIH